VGLKGDYDNLMDCVAQRVLQCTLTILPVRAMKQTALCSLLALNGLQILRYILQPHIAQALIKLDLVENRPPNWHRLRAVCGQESSAPNIMVFRT